jgi:pimeloyl-ACP methyl ester carboxylesterase
MKSIYKKPEAEAIFKEAYDQTLSEWQVPYEIWHVETRFGMTHVIASGPREADPLVLLHGYGFSSTHWVDNIKALSEKHRVYAVDFPGDLNKSVMTVPIETKQDCAAWFADVLDGLSIDKTNIMGLSYGGFLALVIGIYLPERIKKIVTMSPGASLQPQSKRFFLRCIFAWLFPSRKQLNKFMDYMCAKGNTVNAALRNQFIIAMQNCNPRVKVFASYLSDEELASIKSPTLLMIGEHDVQYNPLMAIRRANRLLPNWQTILVKGAGHGLPMERPDVVNAHSLAFLA